MEKFLIKPGWLSGGFRMPGLTLNIESISEQTLTTTSGRSLYLQVLI